MAGTTIKKLFLFFLILAGAGPALALPPPDPRFPEAGIGFELKYLKSHSAGAGLKGFFPEAIIQPQGSYNLLVIMMNFSDVTFYSGAEDYFDDLFFGTGESGAYAGRSFVLFFEDMAAGRFRFNRPAEPGGESDLFFCPEAATGTHDYYGSGGDTLARRGPDFAKEAVNCAHNHGKDLSDYDNNGDGVAESILVIHPGLGEEQCSSSGCGDIWSHSLELEAFQLDGVGIKYALGPEESRAANSVEWGGIGILAHEYIHNWGVPDLYDPNTDQSRGLGFYDLMAYGLYLDPPVYLSAWPRHMLGWLKEKPAGANLCPAELAPVETSGEGYLLYPNRTAGAEYFLVTFNAGGGNDALLPERGLLLWHVDESKWSSGDAYGTPNNESCYPPVDPDCCTRHFLAALEQADGAYHLEVPGTAPSVNPLQPCSATNVFYCDASDYWNSGASFTESTAPGSQTYCGGGSAISLENIKADPSDPDRMIFSLMVDPAVNPIDYPMINSAPAAETEMGELYQYQLNTTGTAPIEYRLVEYPSGVSLAADTGLLTWISNETQIGTNHLVIEAENCRGVNTQVWDLQVTYNPEYPDGEEKSQGCGCDSLGGAGFLPLVLIGFSRFRKSRRGGNQHRATPH